ncbi:LolA family protein [Leeia aquatica]|uniref:Outer membrane lipoprotein carrier protein LolA n=1 Tax=Leeia aquatica TaxID=2725557 RepID=A0A847SFU2_9NEIS|nr:outer membrane lipoprotein carrier protein LolA [Leeia aquatica]NLR76098.1 outer membrane lipoprotein carrier protein LolA [Leeia aquatica]
MRFLIVTLLLISQPLYAALPLADELASRFSQRLDKKPVLRATFVQEKQMAAFKKPLISKGRFVFVAGKGALWSLESPIKVSYIMQDDRVIEIDEQGKRLVRTSKEVPAIAQVSKVFRSLLGAQTQSLQDLFMVQANGQIDAWQMQLQPKPGPVAQFMKQVHMTGGRNVERIRIEETSGDATVITFQGVTEAEQLTGDERALLGQP